MDEDVREIVTDLLLWKMKARKVLAKLICWAVYAGLGVEQGNDLLDELYGEDGEQS